MDLNKNLRAKFQLIALTPPEDGGTLPVTATWAPVYDETIPEDLAFQKATPSGSLIMTIDNPLAVEGLAVGQTCYLDLSVTMTPAHELAGSGAALANMETANAA